VTGLSGCANFAHVVARPLSKWDEVGRRIADARSTAKLTQAELARAVGIDRTAIAKAEGGKRGLNALELAQVAVALRRPIEWFLSESPPSVISRRADRHDVHDAMDSSVDSFARDVELLVEIDALHSVPSPPAAVPETLDAAEALAADVRKRLECPEGPILNLAAMTERLGLYVTSEELGPDTADGAYVALEAAGATVINGSQDAGRRRFTLSHELGHHIVADEYSTDWHLESSHDDRERLMNAFAVHLLMPRQSVLRDWSSLSGDDEPRTAAIQLAVMYRVSWSAACAHLRNIDAIDGAGAAALIAAPPTRADLLELGLFVVEELAPPTVSPEFAKAVLRAYRGGKLASTRVVELLRGTVSREELPNVDTVPIDALRGDVQEWT